VQLKASSVAYHGLRAQQHRLAGMMDAVTGQISDCLVLMLWMIDDVISAWSGK